MLISRFGQEESPSAENVLGMQYPELVAHSDKIRQLPAIHRYLQSEKRYPHVLGTNVIENDQVLSNELEAKKEPVQNFQQKTAGRS